MDIEQAKYEKLWKMDTYRRFSPGEKIAHVFLEVAKHCKGIQKTVLDAGCGTGRGGLKIFRESNSRVTFLDFTSDPLDSAAKLLVRNGTAAFVQQSLIDDITLPRFDYVYCTDVMEHIPPEDVDTVLSNILSAGDRVFIQLSTVPDGMGVLIGEKLHLTIEQPEWWQEKIESLGSTIIDSAVKHTACWFYCEGTVKVPRESVDKDVEERETQGETNPADIVTEDVSNVQTEESPTVTQEETSNADETTNNAG